MVRGIAVSAVLQRQLSITSRNVIVAAIGTVAGKAALYVSSRAAPVAQNSSYSGGCAGFSRGLTIGCRRCGALHASGGRNACPEESAGYPTVGPSSSHHDPLFLATSARIVGVLLTGKVSGPPGSMLAWLAGVRFPLRSPGPLPFSWLCGCVAVYIS